MTASSGWVASSLARWVCSGNRGRGQSLRAADQGLSPMGVERKWELGLGLEGAAVSAFPPALFLCGWML